MRFRNNNDTAAGSRVTQRRAGSMKVHCYSTDGFRELKQPWQQLQEKARDVTVFSTWEWQEAWWQHYGAGRELRLLTAWSDDETLTAVLPYYVSTERVCRAVPIRVARLVGTGADTSPDYMGCIVDPAAEGVAAPLLAAELVEARKEWDVLEFTDMLPSAFADALEAALANKGIAHERQTANLIHYVQLPASWDSLLEAMPRDRRGRIRRQRRKAESELSIVFGACKDEVSLEHTVDALVELHRKRWDMRQMKSSAFQSDNYIRFHREAIRRCYGRGWIRMYFLQTGAATVAVLYCYQFHRKILFFQSGFDPAVHAHSPGNVLFSFAIEDAIREGAEEFDFLQGDHPYKQSWASSQRHTLNLLARRSSSAGLVHGARHGILSFARSVRSAVAKHAARARS